MTGLSSSIFNLVDRTGLFLFYDIIYCLDLMNKTRWNSNELASMTQESFVFIHSAVDLIYLFYIQYAGKKKQFDRSGTILS